MAAFLDRTKHYLRRMVQGSPKYKYTLSKPILVQTVLDMLFSTGGVYFFIWVFRQGANMKYVYYIKVLLVYFIFRFFWSLHLLLNKDFLLTGRVWLKCLFLWGWVLFALMNLVLFRWEAALFVYILATVPITYLNSAVLTATRPWTRLPIPKNAPQVDAITGEILPIVEPPPPPISFKYNWAFVLAGFYFLFMWFIFSVVILGSNLYRPLILYLCKQLNSQDFGQMEREGMHPKLIKDFADRIIPVQSVVSWYIVLTWAWIIYLNIRKDVYASGLQYKRGAVFLILAVCQFAYLRYHWVAYWLSFSIAGLSLASYILAIIGIARPWIVNVPTPPVSLEEEKDEVESVNGDNPHELPTSTPKED